MEYIKLHSVIFLVKGHSRAILIDNQRNNYVFLSLQECEIIENLQKKTVNSVLNQYNKSGKIIADKLIQKLLKNEYAFSCSRSELTNFKKMDLTYKSPYLITNLYLEDPNLKLLAILIKTINDLNIPNIKIVWHQKQSIGYLRRVLSLLESTPLKNIEFVIPNKNYSNKSLFKLFELNKKLVSLIICSCNTSLRLNLNLNRYHNLIRTNKNIKEVINSKINNESYFRNNLMLYVESKSFNTYANRKLVVNRMGQLKNVPEQTTHFGNIKKIQINHLKRIIKSANFRYLWSAKKDKCNVCKDCEFRYMCVDNRLPIKSKNGTWNFSEECNYNPYIAKWKSEPGYKSIKEIGPLI